MERLIELPQMQRDARIRASSFNAEDHSIEVVFAAGAVVRRRSWIEGAYDESLRMTPDAVQLDRLNSGAPFLDSHESYSLSNVIGSVVENSARIENGMGVARVRLSTAASDADIVEKIRTAVVKNISVGYTVDAVEKTERSGEVPLWTVTRWTPLELSAVAIPADYKAQIRSGSTQEGVGTFPAILVEQPPIDVRLLLSRRARAQRMALI